MASRAKPHPDQAYAWLDVALQASAEHPFCEIVTLTPEMARALLHRNDSNRKLSPGLVAQIAADLAAGRWQFNGESIVIARTGELNDGQHRLEAISQSGVAAKLVIVGGAERESRMTLDMGRARTVDDFLRLKGVHYATTLASAARLVLGFEKSNGANFGSTRWVSKSEAIERALSDKALAAAAEWGAKHAPECAHLVPASPLAACYYILAKIDPAKGPEYMLKIARGHSEPAHSAVLSVRRYLPTHSSRHRDPKMALILRGWTYWRRGADTDYGDIHPRYPLPKLD